MSETRTGENENNDECIVPSHPVPAEELARYSVDNDPHSERDIANYAAAISAGGKDNGKPGLRPHYHPNYYGAFVLDPDGHNIEAVCHESA